MPHPKKRKTKSGRNQRRSHHSLKEIDLMTCKKCNQPIKSHRACSNCGYYNGKEVLDVLKKLSKKERIKAEKAKIKGEKKEKKTEGKKTVEKK
jgi:large subunit ribosomal protein L32